MKLSQLLNLIGKTRETDEAKIFFEELKTKYGIYELEIDDDRRSTYINSRKDGISILFSKDIAKFNSIFLYSEGYENFSEYTGELPNNVRFSDNREQIRLKMGTPVKSASVFMKLATNAVTVSNWDLYESDGIAYHFSFRPGSSLLILSIGIPIDDDKE